MKRVFVYKKYFYLLSVFAFILLFVSSCRSSHARDLKEINPEIENLINALKQRSYLVEIQVIRPFNTAAVQNVLNSLLIPSTGNNSNRIDVTGDGNFLSVIDGSVTSDLPFFGEQRHGSGHYGALGNGIVMAGLPKDYKLFLKPKKEAVMITFSADEANNSTEFYDVSLMVFSNMTVNMSINSSHRTVIDYSGVLKWVDGASL